MQKDWVQRNKTRGKGRGRQQRHKKNKTKQNTGQKNTQTNKQEHTDREVPQKYYSYTEVCTVSVAARDVV